jgi:hypothetical protein
MKVQQKILYSVVASSLFAAVSLPSVYYYTNSWFGTGEDSCPAPVTKLIHCAVYLLLQYMVLKIFNKVSSDRQLFMWAVQGTLLYHMVSDSDMYLLSQSIVGQVGGLNLADGSGCPNLMGVGLHSIIFFIALWCLMTLGSNVN